MKQVAQVLAAMERGAVTSVEAAVETGLSVKRCSAHVSYLLGLGLVRKTGRWFTYAKRGHVAYGYEVVR